MAANTIAPNGLSYSRQAAGGSATTQPSYFKIKNGYASQINRGDLVKTLTGASQGYIGLATTAETGFLGVYQTIGGSVPATGIPGATAGGIYDTNTQSIIYGLNGAYMPTIAPPTGVDIGAAVINDPFAVFIVQLVGVTWVESYRGQNVNIASNGGAAASGGNPAMGISSLYADGTTIATSPTLPLRIVGLAGMAGGPQNPANTNPWIEVQLNASEMLATTGI